VEMEQVRPDKVPEPGVVQVDRKDKVAGVWADHMPQGRVDNAYVPRAARPPHTFRASPATEYLVQNAEPQ